MLTSYDINTTIYQVTLHTTKYIANGHLNNIILDNYYYNILVYHINNFA